EDALESLRRLKPDAVITDIRMQVMDGLQFLEQARSVDPDLIAVVLSAYPDFHYAQKALQLHAEDYLVKPVNEDELRRLLAVLARKCEARRPHHVNRPFPGTPDVVSADGKTPPVHHDKLLADVERYLQEHFASPVMLQELSSRFGLVPHYLSALFRKRTGETPGEYVTRLRVEEAKRLIDAQPGVLLKQVADAVGFQDPFYFSKVFKKATGQSPSQYMK
ncbi:MAG: helix-turn-helix domain-containing protein, partial [Paenibacillaceae bacterium]|nr:helix-turn-helix domain-containing protein [Paenibacillaceae bacterium]